MPTCADHVDQYAQDAIYQACWAWRRPQISSAQLTTVSRVVSVGIVHVVYLTLPDFQRSTLNVHKYSCEAVFVRR